MTRQEFLDLFDVLYNNTSSNLAPGLDAYEKSVYLTRALNELVKAYFNPVYNKALEGFDSSEKRQTDFSNLIKVYSFESDLELAIEGGTVSPRANAAPPNINDPMIDRPTIQVFDKPLFDTRKETVGVILPNDVLFIINELCLILRLVDGKRYDLHLQIMPIPYVEYLRLMSKPFKRPYKNLAWRIMNSKDSNVINDIVPGVNDFIKKYLLRYVRRPKAIILEELYDVTIDGQSHPLDCELNEELHEEILTRAVELAKNHYTGMAADLMQEGNLSSTEKGIIPKLQ